MNVFTIIFPIIAVTATGYACARWQFLNRSQIDGLSKLTFTLLMPAFLFVTMATTAMSNIFDLKVMAAFYLPVLSIYALTMLYHYWFARKDRRQLGTAAVYAMGNTYSNVVLLGLPVIMSALGEAYVPYVFLILTLHGIVMIGFTNFCGAFNPPSATQPNNKSGLLRKLAKLFSNPILASLVGGMLYNLSGIGLEQTLADSLRLLGKPGISCALLVLGSSLHFYSVKGKMLDISVLTVTKLIILPLSVWLCARYLFELSNELTAVVVILSASPTGVNAYLIACGQHKHEALIASTVVITTVLCMFSISGWLVWLL